MKNEEKPSSDNGSYHLTEEQESIFLNMVNNDASTNELIELLEGFIKEHQNKGE